MQVILQVPAEVLDEKHCDEEKCRIKYNLEGYYYCAEYEKNVVIDDVGFCRLPACIAAEVKEKVCKCKIYTTTGFVVNPGICPYCGGKVS